MTDLLQLHGQRLAILSMGQMSLYFQSTLTRVWAPVGQTPRIHVSPQREMIHFYGALEVQLGREIAVPALEQTSAVTADFIRLLLLHFPTLTMSSLADVRHALPGMSSADVEHKGTMIIRCAVMAELFTDHASRITFVPTALSGTIRKLDIVKLLTIFCCSWISPPGTLAPKSASS